MWTLFLVFALAEICNCYCPKGFNLIRDGECRGSVANMTLNHDQVVDVLISKCKEINGQPIIIHDNEHQQYWSSRAVAGDIPMLMLGITCNSASTKWEWADGSPLDFRPSAYYDPGLDDACIDNGTVFHIHPEGSWGNGRDVIPILTDISCTTQLHLPVNDDNCEYFEDDSADGVCYQVGDTAKNWQDAQMACKKLGANLASIHNLQENSFLRRLAVSRGDVNGILLGATISGKEEKFGWIDGSDWDYDNFAPGFPKPGFGDCIAMDTSTSTGQWKNIDNTEAYPVACIRDQKVTVEPICSTEVWKEGAMITSPGFPYNASTPCDYYLMVDEGKKIEVEIILLEANSCCDNLVLYDGYVGGVVLANLTGALNNVTFTTTSAHKMLVSWLPNGGVNVMGLAMTFRGV